MDPSHASPPDAPARLSESPWLWLVIFSLAGLVALSIVGPKYAVRQRHVELKNRAREEMQRRQIEGATEPTSIPPEAPHGQQPLKLRLDPLRWLLVVLLIVGLIALAWRYRLDSRPKTSGSTKPLGPEDLP